MNMLKEFRLKAGLSQEGIARKMNVTVSYYSQIERGLVNAGRGFMLRLKAAFPDACIDEIFFTDLKTEAV
jgi:transcriptional regulator with XRE-family HTH domain